jgi:MFS family permease
MRPRAHSVMNTETRKKADRRILIIFGFFVLLSFALPIGLSPLFKGVTLSDVVARIIGGLVLSCFLVGVSSFLNYRREGLTTRRRLIVLVLAVSVILSLFLTGIVVMVILTMPGEIEMPDLGTTPLEDQLGVVFAFLMAGLVPSMFFGVLLFMIVAFGIVGVMSAVIRWATPRILRTIVDSGGKTKLSLQDRSLRWLFAIPDTLDTKTLSLTPSSPRRSLSRFETLPIVGWQIFFGAILAIYVSLNPFLSNRSTEALLTIFTALTSASLLIPFVVLPWFIYRRLGARIKGQVKDFTLFNGLRARIFQSYIALGTLVILVRLSISEIDIGAYALGFTSFMGFLFTTAVMCTYVYLNNFENGLAEDIAAAFARKIPTSSEDKGSADNSATGESAK